MCTKWCTKGYLIADAVTVQSHSGRITSPAVGMLALEQASLLLLPAALAVPASAEYSHAVGAAWSSQKALLSALARSSSVSNEA